MAALAIPIVILGSIYILSEQEKKESGKNIAVQEKIQKQNFLSGGSRQTENFSNYKEEIIPIPSHVLQSCCRPANRPLEFSVFCLIIKLPGLSSISLSKPRPPAPPPNDDPLLDATNRFIL